MNDNPNELLANLVKALETAFISTWQSTHHWDKELQEAKDYLEKLK